MKNGSLNHCWKTKMPPHLIICKYEALDPPSLSLRGVYCLLARVLSSFLYVFFFFFLKEERGKRAVLNQTKRPTSEP